MTDCIRSLLINSSHSKELSFCLTLAIFNYLTYLKIEKIFLNMIDD